MSNCDRVLRRVKECRNQIIATAIVTLGSFGTGTVFGWSSVAVASLKETQHFNQITIDMASWVTSLAIFGAFIGGPVSGILMDYSGRKLTILYLTLPFFFGWVIMFMTYFIRPHGFFLLYIGRFLTGFCTGGYLLVVPTYIKEISFEEMQGILGSSMSLLLVSGILFSFVVGGYTNWFVLTVCCTLPPICLALGTLFLPETPRFLTMKGKIDKAVSAFKWSCRIDTDELARERMILAFFTSGIINRKGEVETGPRKKRRFLSRPVIVPICIMVFVMLFQQLAGVNAVSLYTVEIFQVAGDSTVSPETATVILGVVNVLAVIMSMFIVDLLGRKTLIVGLHFVMAICLAGLGTYFYLKEMGSEKDIKWLPALTIYTYMFAYCCGPGSVAWVLGPEVYNATYIAQSATIMTSSYWIFGFFVAKTYDYLKSKLTVAGSFWFYGTFSLGGAIFALFFVPETKGRSYDEISNYFGAIPEEETQDSDENDHSCIPPDKPDSPPPIIVVEELEMEKLLSELNIDMGKPEIKVENKMDDEEEVKSSKSI